MSSVINDETVLKTLREVVAENPEKVYKAPDTMPGVVDGSCFYVHVAEDGTEEPGCIVGTVLHRLGVSLDALKAQEGWGAPHAIDGLHLSDVSFKAQRILRDIQIYQDKGTSWGEAYTNVTGLNVTEPVKA